MDCQKKGKKKDKYDDRRIINLKSLSYYYSNNVRIKV